MNILDKIVRDKRLEVDLRKSIIPTSQLEASVLFNREIVSLAQNLRQSNSGIIAEHKRRSPSKSIINHDLNVQDVASGYEKSGVCGMSVLSDGKYFGGSLDDVLVARASCNLPILRKEFIIDEYQNKIINIHPALLPKYGGKGMYGINVHRSVLENKESKSGISIHFVNKNYDEGKIIFQASCKISLEDSVESLARKIHVLEHQHYSRVIEETIINSDQ